MTDCINCKCRDISPSANMIEYRALNEEKVKEVANAIRDLDGCDLPEYTAKGFYGLWCFNKALLAKIEYLEKQIK